MNRLSCLILILVIAAEAFWAASWGKNSGHLFGDPLLAREMIFAGERFAANGGDTNGLPVYTEGGRPYTHLTPGPEWIQALFALVRGRLFPRVNAFLWHSMCTAALSLAALLCVRRSVAVVARVATGSAEAETWSWTAFAVVATTPAFLIYAPHPYCAGTLLGYAAVFAAAARWSADSAPAGHATTWAATALALCAAFWLGIAPLPAGLLWIVVGALAFSSRGARAQRMRAVAAIASITIGLCLAAKLVQSYAYFGSWSRVMSDNAGILLKRATGDGGSFSIWTHLAMLLPKLIYTTGAGVPAIVVLGRLARRWVAQHQAFVVSTAATAFTWQVVMAGHAYLMIYMNREAVVPIALLIAVFGTVLQGGGKKIGVVTAAVALAQLAFVMIVLIVPLSRTGLPLWQLHRLRP